KSMDVTPEDKFTSHDKDAIYAPREEANIDDRRLGVGPCKLCDDSKIRNIYDNEIIYERHRNKYEFNFKFADELESAGDTLSRLSPDDKYLEAMEIEDHPWYIGVQYHPEFISRPTKPHPLITDFVKAVIESEDK